MEYWNGGEILMALISISGVMLSIYNGIRYLIDSYLISKSKVPTPSWLAELQEKRIERIFIGVVMVSGAAMALSTSAFE